MKIIIWNCNMAFRKKSDFILTEKPDLLVLPECESPEKLILKKGAPNPTDMYWFGENPNKGIGILSFSDLKISPLPHHNKDFRFVIPLLIQNAKTNLILLAIWAQKPEKHDNYGENVWNAVNYYTDLLKNENVIVAGDFNSGSPWDKPNREANHSNIVKKLSESGIESTYHFFKNQEQGKEAEATLYLHRKIHKPFHIDYCFASKALMKELKEFRIGKFEDWIKYSDHLPLIVTFGQ